MRPLEPTLAALIAAAVGLAAPALAHTQQKPPPKKAPMVINDPSLYRPPPPPHERTYVQPGPSTAPPMERIPQVAPLAQPPTR